MPSRNFPNDGTGQGGAEWDTQPIRNPAKAAWDVQVSGEDVQKLQKGFVPEMMEDKWLCYSDPRDESGVVLVRLCRSWTKTDEFVLKLQLAQGTEAAGARITEITWETQDAEEDLGEGEAKEVAVMVCNGVIGCSLEIQEAN
ncbi:hypothetical protein PWT90_04035 [Aphanocladium album]|nr:hypothetical protein PWT90_04035 [Aphanocladium album]